jgi:hypothetical protein
MTRDQIDDTLDRLPHTLSVALHVCGKGVEDLVLNSGPSEADRLVRRIAQRAGRVQLNGFFGDDPGMIPAIRNWCRAQQGLGLSGVITQHNAGNVSLTRALEGDPLHGVLFDACAGQGTHSGTDWPECLPGLRCGYAGGLGPDTLEHDLRAIFNAAGGAPDWIDMEGCVRNARDLFCLNRVESCLKICDQAQENGAHDRKSPQPSETQPHCARLS